MTATLQTCSRFESEIAAKIVSQLKSKLSPQEKAAIGQKPTVILLLTICTFGPKL